MPNADKDLASLNSSVFSSVRLWLVMLSLDGITDRPQENKTKRNEIDANDFLLFMGLIAFWNKGKRVTLFLEGETRIDFGEVFVHFET